jgi:nitrate reductase delta subunit
MRAVAGDWDAFAGLFSYPAGNAARVQREWAPRVLERWPALAPSLAPLVDHLARHGEGDCEELFTRTFDGCAERALELGWHIHGENYARGVLLVRLRGLMRAAALDEQGELPDHLANVLRLLGRVDATTARALVEFLLAPGLEKLVEGFGDGANPYREALAGLRRALRDECAEERAA